MRSALIFALALSGCAGMMSRLHPDAIICSSAAGPIASLVTSSVGAITAAGPIGQLVCTALDTQPTTTSSMSVTSQASSGQPAPVKLGVQP